MENFCDRVAILADGRVRVVGSPDQLGARLPHRSVYRIVVQGNAASMTQKWGQIEGLESIKLISEGTATTAYDLSLSDEKAWLSVMKVVGDLGGRVETYRRVDDQSLRRIVAHFSNEDMETDSSRSIIQSENQGSQKGSLG